jgi:LacI family transcriptional regulator
MLESDYDLKITHLRRDKSPKETYSQFFFRKGIRGAIIRSTSADRDVARLIGDEGFPAVVLGDRFDHPRLAFAYNESGTASTEGVEHLISLGHRRIAFAANDTDDGDHIDRLEAYRETTAEHGLRDPQLEFRVPAHRLDGAQLMRKMMSINAPPTAVFVADPLTACGAINEARKLGLRIPEEMSILGFDDTDSRFSVEPTMTAICQDSRELGRLAFEMLVQRCEGLHSEVPGELGKAWLEINHTTARAPAKLVRIMPNGERLPVPG